MDRHSGAGGQGKRGYGSGKETLRLRSKGPATVEVVGTIFHYLKIIMDEKSASMILKHSCSLEANQLYFKLDQFFHV